MDYKDKYLKYKKKYINLKKMKQSGGYFDGKDLYPTIKTVEKLISNDKICRIINKKIAPILKKKIELNIYFVPWFLGFCDDDGDCHLINYNAYTEYLDVFHENWEDNKYLIIGLEATMGNANKNIKPSLSLSKYFNCFINKFKLKNKLNLEDKIVIFQTFDTYLPRHFSWTGSNKR